MNENKNLSNKTRKSSSVAKHKQTSSKPVRTDDHKGRSSTKTPLLVS
jgi:hypothetical protein